MSRFPRYNDIRRDYESATGRDFITQEFIDAEGFNSSGLQSVLYDIESTFAKHFYVMDFLFTQRVRDQRIVTSIIRGLPRGKFTLAETDLVRFEVTAHSLFIITPGIEKGWDHVGFDISKKKLKNTYFTHCFLAIPGVYEVVQYEYGFQIFSTSGIELFAIICKYWNNASVGELMSRSGQPLSLPLADEDTFPPTVVWKNTSEDFVKKFGNIAFPIGQASRELIIED